MNKNDFFQEVEHSPVPWRQYQLHVPLFYQDIRFMSILVLVPTEKIKSMLPSKRLKPYRITPWHGVMSITCYEYRESDLNPYNEVAIGFPVTIDEETPIFTGSLRRMPANPMAYIHQIPVTTEIAREVGAELAGYPKFIAGIEFSEKEHWLACALRADDQLILKLSGRMLDLKALPRYRVNPLTQRQGYILRSEFVISEAEMGESKNGEDVRLELGEHPIAKVLKGLDLGKVLGYQYCPHAEGILTPVFESFAI